MNPVLLQASLPDFPVSNGVPIQMDVNDDKG